MLLPPSEGKSAPKSGAPLDLETLAFPEVNPLRERLLSNLERLATRKLPTALKALKLSEGQAGEVERDGLLRSAPAAPAHEVYTGVLYEHLGLSDLPLAARERVLISSALWGMVRTDDRIPAYRLSMNAQLPRIGPLPAYWRPGLRKRVADEGLIVDLRSGTYAAAWTPRAANVVTVRGFVETAGKRTVVSHMVKATRGDVARALLTASTTPSDHDQVADAVQRSDFVRQADLTIELTPSAGGWCLDVIATS
jgi:cytoplasmic iron level regulating protein YaaA (DUF328/UPF0246 family)